MKRVYDFFFDRDVFKKSANNNSLRTLRKGKIKSSIRERPKKKKIGKAGRETRKLEIARSAGRAAEHMYPPNPLHCTFVGFNIVN